MFCEQTIGDIIHIIFYPWPYMLYLLKKCEMPYKLGVERIWKYKFGSGIGSPINFKYGTGPLKTLPESTCITGEAVHRHKSFKYVNYNIKFAMATEFFSIFSIWRASNQSILSLRVASTFRVGNEEQIPALPGRIHVPVPSLMQTIQQSFNNDCWKVYNTIFRRYFRVVCPEIHFVWPTIQLWHQKCLLAENRTVGMQETKI